MVGAYIGSGVVWRGRRGNTAAAGRGRGLNDWLGCDCGTMIHDAELRGGLRSTVRTFRHIGIFNSIRQVDEEQVGYGYGKRQVDRYTSRALRCATISKSRPGMAKKPNSRKIESPSKLPY